MKRLIVGMSGASGVIYGIRMLEVLKAVGGIETHLVMSRFARLNIEIETTYTPRDVESLADVVERVRPYFEAEIWPHVAAGENVLVAAHGNSLRAVLVIIGEYDAEDIPNIELPTGKPLVFDIENGEKQRHYYLED